MPSTAKQQREMRLLQKVDENGLLFVFLFGIERRRSI